MEVSIVGSKGFIGSHLKGRGYDLPECDLLKPVKIEGDVVVYVAGVNHQTNTDQDVITGNIVTTYNLLKGINPSARLVYLSTVKAGNDTIYGQVKLLAEKLLTHRPLSLIRSNHVFGERALPFYSSVVSTFCHQAVMGQEFKINNAPLNLVYIGDLVKVIKEEINNKKDYSYRVVEGYQTTVQEVADIIRSFKTREPKTELEEKIHRVYKWQLLKELNES